MTAIFYEPMYEFERLFDEAFSGSQESGSGRKGYRRIGRGEGDGGPRSLKPRYVPNPPLLILTDSSTNFH